MTESDSEAKATKGAVAASGSEEARDIESAIGEDERESNRGAALAIVVAHMALMLLSGAALGVLSSGGFSNGTSGLILAFGSMLYPVLLPATVVAVVPAALMLPFAFGPPPRSPWAPRQPTCLAPSRCSAWRCRSRARPPSCSPSRSSPSACSPPRSGRGVRGGSKDRVRHAAVHRAPRWRQNRGLRLRREGLLAEDARPHGSERPAACLRPALSALQLHSHVLDALSHRRRLALRPACRWTDHGGDPPRPLDPEGPRQHRPQGDVGCSRAPGRDPCRDAEACRG